jgi:hypothetical protein
MFFNLSDQSEYTKEELRAFKLTKPVKPADIVIEDEFTIKYTDPKCDIMTPDEVRMYSGMCLVNDVESFPNYFLSGFKLYGHNKYIMLHEHDRDKLAYLLYNYMIVGFNSRVYDLRMNTLAMSGMSAQKLNEASLSLITMMWDTDFEDHFKVKLPKINHVDLIEVAPLRGSLKLYAGRLHCQRMQDLPFDPNRELMPAEKIDVAMYNVNDLNNTELVMRELEPDLTLRNQMSKEYGIDLRSKSDAQVAETVIAAEIERMTGNRPQRNSIKPGTTFFYKMPAYINYRTPQLQLLADTIKRTPLVVNDVGSITLPEEIEGQKISLGQCVYRIGIGGLHSSEKSVWHKADAHTLLIDRDVVSYYPAIILNDRLYPQHLGVTFLEVYSRMVQRRIEAKRTGNKKTADSLKISINGSFGKLGNKYSVLYSPDLLMQVTITGQLSLLMLIEMIEEAAIPVVSANTDGVVIKCPIELQNDLDEVVKMWERITKFETEASQYAGVYSRDVNNYIAVGTDGKVKTKGTFSERGSAGNSFLSRNPEAFICNDAVRSFLTDRRPVEDTICNCTDIRRFITVRNVKGGASKSGIYLGKTIRHYQSTAMFGRIEYATSGNMVANTIGARPMMELLDKIPDDLDYKWYIARANSMLVDIGVLPKPEKGTTEVVPVFYAEQEELFALAT